MSKRSGRLRLRRVSEISPRDSAFILNALEVYALYIASMIEDSELHPGGGDWKGDLAHCRALRDRLEGEYKQTYGEALQRLN